MTNLSFKKLRFEARCGGESLVPAPGRARLKDGEFDISLSCIDGVFRQNKQNTTKKQRTNKLHENKTKSTKMRTR